MVCHWLVFDLQHSTTIHIYRLKYRATDLQNSQKFHLDDGNHSVCQNVWYSSKSDVAEVFDATDTNHNSWL